MKASDDILAECSDEEEYGRVGVKYENTWSPFPPDIIDLYTKIARKSLDFEWKCTGRRNPNNSDDEPTTTQVTLPVTVKKETEPEATDFDFEEDAAPQLSRFGKSTALKGGGKKKTTSLAGILSNMERHRILEQKQILGKGPKSKLQNPTVSK